jgi:hypothetical protein
MKYLIYTSNGKVEVVPLKPTKALGMVINTESQIIRKNVGDRTDYIVQEESELPNIKYKDAWEFDPVKKTIKVDNNKALNIVRNEILTSLKSLKFIKFDLFGKPMDSASKAEYEQIRKNINTCNDIKLLESTDKHMRKYRDMEATERKRIELQRLQKIALEAQNRKNRR